MKKVFLVFFMLLYLLEAKELITPIPLEVAYDKAKAQLGKKLFSDLRLSADDTVSCASCHILDDGGDDNMQFSVGIKGQIGPINAPTVFNSRYNIAQFWDGRAKDLQEQAHGPITNPLEMGESFKPVVSKLRKDEELVKEFKSIYKEGITPETITDAIAQFEKALVTPNAPFDYYLRGDKSYMSQEQIEGYAFFKEYGCISCHNGVNIGGNLFQKVGVVKKFKTDVKSLGKYELTGNDEDINYFKVPTLRNISKTAPYFHDGSVYELKNAVKVMFDIQLGVVPTEDEIQKIVSFLKSLEGQMPSILNEDKK
ncbi:MAG: cytochrome-c peroxidase [Campylobacterota bacterium]|nr:cytochrome-c peroxidase [Campylobacterota bacterium]